MLTKVHIQNYQSHQDTVLELGPGVNVIVGQSNAGKSACVRAMNWPITNRPLGVGFIRTGQDEAAVLLEETRTDGTEVSVQRIRGKSRNEYILNKDTQNPFTAFGSSPPEDVLRALNLTEINIQTQFAPYFLVFDSAGQVGSAIRQVTGMERIDKVCDIISSRIRTVGGRIKDREIDLDSAKEKLKIVSKVDLDRLGNLIGQAESLVDRKDALITTQKRLQNLVSNLIAVQKNKITLPEERLAQIGALITQRSGELVQQRTIHQNLQNLIGGLRSASSNRVVFPSNLDLVLSRREVLVNQYNTLISKIQKLAKMVGALERCVIEGQELDGVISTAEKDSSQLMSQLTTCPLCSSSLTDVTKRHLLEHANDRR